MRWRLPLPVLVVITAITLATSSCLSPTLPLPPPEQPDSITVGAPATGTWKVSGSCDAGAIVTVINEKTGVGVVVEDRTNSGSYSVTLAGTQCDVATVRELFMGQESGATSFTLAPHLPGDPTDNPLCH